MARTILVADDSQTIRRIVEMALKASPYQIMEADSARGAMDAAQRGPDLILLDYYMPDGSGYEVCRAIKSSDSTRAIPVIMLGGTYRDFDEGQARQAGADAVVMKPFKTDQLIDAMESALSGASSNAGSALDNAAYGGPPPRPQASGGVPMPPPNPFGAPAPPRTNSSSGFGRPQPGHHSGMGRPQPPIPSNNASGMGRPQPPSGNISGMGRQQTPPAAPAGPPAAPSGSYGQPHPNQSGAGFGGGSQPRIPSSMSQSNAPSGGSQPGIDPRPGVSATPAVSDGASGGHGGLSRAEIEQIVRDEVSASARDASNGGGDSLSRAQIEEIVREEVKVAVREELPGLLRSVMGDLFQQKILPRLVKHSEQRITELLDTQLASRIQEPVRLEIERLLRDEG